MKMDAYLDGEQRGDNSAQNFHWNIVYVVGQYFPRNKKVQGIKLGQKLSRRGMC